jgi:hypothetical protein
VYIPNYHSNYNHTENIIEFHFTFNLEYREWQGKTIINKPVIIPPLEKVTMYGRAISSYDQAN